MKRNPEDAAEPPVPQTIEHLINNIRSLRIYVTDLFSTLADSGPTPAQLHEQILVQQAAAIAAAAHHSIEGHQEGATSAAGGTALTSSSTHNGSMIESSVQLVGPGVAVNSAGVGGVSTAASHLNQYYNFQLNQQQFHLRTSEQRQQDLLSHVRQSVSKISTIFDELEHGVDLMLKSGSQGQQQQQQVINLTVNESALALDNVQGGPNGQNKLYVEFCKAVKIHDKLHEYASHCSTLLNQQSLKRSQSQFRAGANKQLHQLRRVQFNPYNYRNNNQPQSSSISPNVGSIDPIGQVVNNITRSFQLMEAVYSRPFGLSSGVIQLCVGKVFKAVLVLRGIVIDAVIVKAFHESFSLNHSETPGSAEFVNENNDEIDIWSESKYLVFRKVTQQANSAMLHFHYPLFPEIALKSFVAWLNAYADLYNVVCIKCHSRLRNFLPPTCRDTRIGFDPYHDNCK